MRSAMVGGACAVGGGRGEDAEGKGGSGRRWAHKHGGCSKVAVYASRGLDPAWRGWFNARREDRGEGERPSASRSKSRRPPPWSSPSVARAALFVQMRAAHSFDLLLPTSTHLSCGRRLAPGSVSSRTTRLQARLRLSRAGVTVLPLCRRVVPWPPPTCQASPLPSAAPAAPSPRSTQACLPRRPTCPPRARQPEPPASRRHAKRPARRIRPPALHLLRVRPRADCARARARLALRVLEMAGPSRAALLFAMRAGA